MVGAVVDQKGDKGSPLANDTTILSRWPPPCRNLVNANRKRVQCIRRVSDVTGEPVEGHLFIKRAIVLVVLVKITTDNGTTVHRQFHQYLLDLFGAVLNGIRRVITLAWLVGVQVDIGDSDIIPCNDPRSVGHRYRLSRRTTDGHSVPTRQSHLRTW